MFVCSDGNELVKYDISTCSYQLIGYTSKAMLDIALTPHGKLYGIDGKRLYLIDTSNAYTQFFGIVTGDLTLGGSWINSLVAIDDEYLLGAGTGYSDTLLEFLRMMPQNHLAV